MYLITVELLAGESQRWSTRELTSGSGHKGSLNRATSQGLITSILTSCATRTFLPRRVSPLISKLRMAWSFFFASLTMTSCVWYDEDEVEEEADLSAPR